MASVIDVKALSKNEVIHLIKDLLNENILTHQLLSEVADINKSKDSTENINYIEALIDKHFEEYDEVFRKLA
jgi:hypothetical protein